MPQAPLLLAAVMLALAIGTPAQAKKIDKYRAKCADYGFQEGTDAFANCVMRLSQDAERQQGPDRQTLIRIYRSRSMARRGDDRYPVCSAAMTDNELDITINKWVGPNCQMAPD